MYKIFRFHWKFKKLYTFWNKYLKKLNLDSKQIESEIAKRAEAKKVKDFETADSIRANLDEKGIILNDTVEGTVWDIKELYSTNQ